MTTTVCSGRSIISSSSLPLQLPALIPRGPCCSSSSFTIPKPKPKHFFTPHHHHLNSPALPCTSTTSYLFSSGARTTKKKPILTVTNINSNTPTGGGAGASQSQPSYQGRYGPWTIQPSDVTEVTFSALISPFIIYFKFNPTYMYNLPPQCLPI